MFYNASNWFWVVASSTTQVWASARLSYVPVTDATYVTWVADGGTASRIGSVADLYGVMAAQVVPGLMAAGVAITSTATPAINATYALDPTSQAQITAVSTGIAAGRGLPGGGSTFNWPSANGTMMAFTIANFLNFAIAVESLVYNFNNSLINLCSGGVGSLPSNALTIA